MSAFQDLSVLPTEIRMVLVSKEEVSCEQQGWHPSLDQDTKPSLIKEEQEKLCISQDGEMPQGQEEAEIKFTFSPVTVKSEDDEENPQILQLHQIKTEQMERGADGEDCGGSEETRSSNSLLRAGDVKIEESATPWDEDLNNAKCTAVYQSDLYSVGRIRDQAPKTDKKMHNCSDCGTVFNEESVLFEHMKIRTKVNMVHAMSLSK
ncbi:uncharacterized protein LOC121523453 [Cheilinus undulatus]|uniref:uncharacterized protein LOC121523453 n=1 Tax=Cheilinus undulatus TaxID=241271 RepID=UPI001BD5D7D0|nr:uncharacterized protein LOC121523453 [Cheilinus undulatus]